MIEELDRDECLRLLATEPVGRVAVGGWPRAARAARQTRLDLEPWAPGDKPVWVRIVPSSITGRRLTCDPG